MDLEKAFDRVLREVIHLAMCKLGVDEWLVSAAMTVYVDGRTVIGQFMVIVKCLVLGLVCVRVQL